jgi:ribosomal protein S27AE
MKYQHMNFCKFLSELDSEEKARTWIWLAKFDGKEFICPKCSNETCWQHHKNPEIWECKKCHFEVRLRAGTIFQKSKTPLLIWLRAICLVTQGKAWHFSHGVAGRPWDEVLWHGLGSSSQN